ncbi:unnamed protein product [Dicrocoelium dendriticum]|nr:unnamed protein product [Dicrocoelium dendriticum]
MIEPITDFNFSWQRALILNNDAANCFERKLMRARRSIHESVQDSSEALNDLLHRLSCNTNTQTCKLATEQTAEAHSHASRSDMVADLASSVQIVHPPAPEFFEDLIERICSHRIRLYELGTKNLHLQGEWVALADEIEEIEARALTAVILPSSVLEDISVDTNSQLKSVLDRLESQATRCLAAAEALALGQPLSTKEDAISAKRDAPETFSQTLKSIGPPILKLSWPTPTLSEARQLCEQSAALLYPLLSDYKLREQTLQVKRIVSCACSQVTRQDPVHCLDRMRYVISFLSGEPVKFAGRSSKGGQSKDEVTLTDLLPPDLGTVYAWHCLFSATLSQAEHQFAYHHESAVVYAILLSGVFARYPEKTVLHGLLEIGGSILMRLYGVQFDKLLLCIASIIHSSVTLSQSSPEIALLSTIDSLRQR